MAPLRISAISFLNTAPLMWDFEQGVRARELAQHFDISYTVPSRCAEQLKAGSADIGIIPVAAYTTIPDLVVVPGVSIAAKNAVRSILLVSKVPVERIRNVATDDSSRTSSALVEVFLRKFVGVAPGFTRQPPNLEEMLKWHDAALLIGDPALQADTDGYHVYDLAEQWQRWTGRPFVFAFWAVRRAALAGASPGLNLAQVFQQSRDHGLQHIPEIVAKWAALLRLSERLVSDYLTENVDYSLDAGNLEGLRLFFRYAQELQILPPARELEFL
jgi:chorismate dehydratase